MSWILARDQKVRIVENTIPTSTKRGASKKSFKYAPEASRDKLPDTRCFWFEIKKMAMTGVLTVALPRRSRFEVDLIVAYHADVGDPAALFDTIAADHTALIATLANQDLWGRPDSTIETLFLGAPLIAVAELERVGGRVLMIIKLVVEFRTPQPASL